MDEANYYNDPKVSEEPELFHYKTPQLRPTPAAVSTDTEDSDHENSQDIIIALEPETPQSPATVNSVRTAPSSHESPHNSFVDVPPEIS